MPLDPLATTDDLDARMNGGLPVGDVTRAEALLVDASSAVRDAAGQTLTEATSTLVWLKVRRGIVRLPQRPVTAVSAVEDENGNDVTYTWLGDDRVRLSLTDAINAWELVPYSTPLGEVRVTYDHGYAAGAIPDLIVGITCNAALRALGRDGLDGSVQQESIEGYSYQTGSIGAAGPVGLLPEEKLRLQSFLRPHGYSRQSV